MKKNDKNKSVVLANFPKAPAAGNPLAGVNRNGPCPCGSGKKWKKCCLAQEHAARRMALSMQDDQQKALRDELDRLEREETERIERIRQEIAAKRQARAAAQ